MWAHYLILLSVFLLQHADLELTKLRPQMPTAPNVLLTARPRRNKPSSASVRKVSTALRPTHARWHAHVSDTKTSKKLKQVISRHSHDILFVHCSEVFTVYTFYVFK